MARPTRVAAIVAAAAALALVFVAGCSSTASSSSSSRATSPPVPPATTKPVAAAASKTSTALPSEVSNLPDGVYRSQLTDALLNKLGADPSDAGTWTLTVSAGAYQLQCRPMSDPGFDCGNHDPSQPDTVEIGTVRGSGMTVWFVHDQARLAKLTGCIQDSLAADGCGPDGGYHLDWKATAHGMAFSAFVGLGDEAGEPALNEKTAQPWTRIS